jgi:hypothetical protein
MSGSLRDVAAQKRAMEVGWLSKSQVESFFHDDWANVSIDIMTTRGGIELSHRLQGMRPDGAWNPMSPSRVTSDVAVGRVATRGAKEGIAVKALQPPSTFAEWCRSCA